MIDTADVYSAWVPGHQGGESETVIGRWLKRDPAKRDKVVIATKVGFMATGSRRTRSSPACEASLQRLGVETIDLYYQHKDDEDVPLGTASARSTSLREAGQGPRDRPLATSPPTRLDEAMRRPRRNGLLAPCALQPWYNLVEREKFEGELRDAALRNGLGIFPFYSLANGFLTGKYRSKDDLGKSPRGLAQRRLSRGQGHARARGARRDRGGDRRRARDHLAGLADGPAGVTAPIASATSVEQLAELTAAMDLTLSLEQIARLDAASAEAVAGLALLQHIQRGDRHRLGRGGDHGFRLGRPERAVQRGQLGIVAAGRVPWPWARRRPRRSRSAWSCRRASSG